jgi:hypothetical protein
MKRTSTLLIIGILVFILVGSYTGYLIFNKSTVDANLKKTQASLLEYENKMSQYQNLEVLEAINAKKTLDELDSDIIKWSKVIKHIRKTIPKNGSLPVVEVLSYSGSASNDISMNVKTYPESSEPYLDVAALIKAFNEDAYFVNSFVPSISTGTDDEGNKILTFLFSTTYVESDVLVEEEVESSDSVVR